MLPKKPTLFFMGVLAFAAVAQASDFTVSVPENASLAIGSKSKHYVDFTPEQPTAKSTANGVTTYTFDLTSGKVYNYRTWMPGGLTQAGYFTMNSDATKRPTLKFSAQDYKSASPTLINHSPQNNGGYETGDIFVNINPQGYLRLESGATYDAHAMRTWELTDNAVNNYFIEPDFHYTVVGLDGKPSSNVIRVEEQPGSPWAKIKAVGKGTAIVLVTYDAIKLNYYSGADKKEYLGGELWGAIWPENTAVYVVSVDETLSSANANMVINEKYNEDSKKNSGKFVDAEHDVFYYISETGGYDYSFTPQNVAKVEIAYPVIGKQTVSFSGFGTEGVSRDGDTYTVRLKQGRQIVKLTDYEGNSTYQVLTAKPCDWVIANGSREGSTIFQPGDEIKIQFSGLYHPANKLAGIYNMSAYVTYNGIPNGTSLIQGSGQYTFASAPDAQALTIRIPDDYNVHAHPNFKVNDGVIQVNGFGDPIGNHRIIDPTVGRSPNFNAVAHKTYFGSLPVIDIPLQEKKMFNISYTSNVDGIEVSLVLNGEKEVEKAGDALFRSSYGHYLLTAGKDGYCCFRTEFTLGEEDDLDKVVEIAMTEGVDGMWNGKDVTEVSPSEDGIYHISNGAQLAYIAGKVNEQGKKFAPKVLLDADIDLGGYNWTPVGNSSNFFYGSFNGQGHTITGLYVKGGDYAGLFGEIQGLSTSKAMVTDLTVEGIVTGVKYVAGVVGKVDKYSAVERCANMANVTGDTYVGGVVGYLSTSTQCTLTDCYNKGDIEGSATVGGVIGGNNASAVITNVYNTGNVIGLTANSVGACVGGTTKKTKATNLYSTIEREAADGSITVSKETMASGEVAYKLGETFTQNIGKEDSPVFNSSKVLYDADTDTYYNTHSCFALMLTNSEITLDIDEAPAQDVSATYHPAKADEPSVAWTSSDEKVVKVTHEGTRHATLTAVGKGKATVKVEHTDNPSVYDSCEVFVTTPTGITDVLEGDCDTLHDVYDLSGKPVLLNADKSSLETLTPGFYIIRGNGIERKVIIRW